MALVWLNGNVVDAEQASISVADRGFTLADGVFETIRAHLRQCLWLHEHLERLRDGADCLGIPFPWAENEIARAITRLLDAWAHEASAVRVTLSRGASERRGVWPPSDRVQPTLLITGAPLSVRNEGDVVIARTTRRNDASPLSRMKSLNYGDNVLARREASSARADEALLLNTRGRIACAAAGNIFLRLGDSWVTPPISEGVLPGLARKRLIPALGASEIELTEAMLSTVDGALISNSLGCMAVRRLEGRELADIGSDVRRIALYD